MRYVLEFNAKDPEEVARVLGTVKQLHDELAATTADSRPDDADGLPAAVLKHIGLAVRAPRQRDVRAVCETEATQRQTRFMPAPLPNKSIGLFLPDVPEATYARVHPTRATLRLPPEYATHNSTRFTKTGAYRVTVDITTPDGIAEFHRLAEIAAQHVREEFQS